jgi:hypothetical protein
MAFAVDTMTNTEQALGYHINSDVMQGAHNMLNKMPENT